MNDTMQPMENLEVCPACSGMVSKEAETCPHCGHPVGADRRHAIWEQRKNEAQDILKSATRQSKNWGLKICNLIWRIPVFFLALIGLGIPAAIILAVFSGESWGIGMVLMLMYTIFYQRQIINCAAKLFSVGASIIIGWVLLVLTGLGTFNSVANVCQRYAAPDLFGCKPPFIPLYLSIIFVVLMHIVLMLFLYGKIGEMKAEKRAGGQIAKNEYGSAQGNEEKEG